jgi:hypothetical protein
MSPTAAIRTDRMSKRYGDSTAVDALVGSSRFDDPVGSSAAGAPRRPAVPVADPLMERFLHHDGDGNGRGPS